jgi:hypothetical protein
MEIAARAGRPEPQPRPVPTAPYQLGEQGLVSNSTHFLVQHHTRDAVKLVDQDDNVLAMVFRQGRIVGNERVQLPMLENAERMANGLRATRG